MDSEPAGPTCQSPSGGSPPPPGFWRRWRSVLVGAVTDSITDRMSLAAAGCAFYATLALFPAISTLISVYGLAFNPEEIESQLMILRHIVPAPAFQLILGRVRQLITAPHSNLSVGLAISFALTVWSASTGTRSVLSALNVAHDLKEQRNYFKFQLIGLAMTMAGILVAALGVAFLVFLPAAIGFIGLSHYSGGLLQAAAMILLIGVFAASLAVLYRLGPARRPPPDEPIIPGVVLAIVLWVIASLLLSWYVSHIASFGVTYGPLGAVVGIMLWFYVSAFTALLGAELNVRLQRHPRCTGAASPR